MMGRKKKQKRRKQKKEPRVPITLKMFGLFFLVIIFLGESKKYYLRNYGLEVPGRIQKVRESKGPDECSYYFNLNGEMIKNESLDNDFHPGDSITILYVEKFPWINAPMKNIVD